MKFNEFISSFQYTNDGIGKNTSINDVNKEQLLVGIAVEMEHTTDLNQSASIAIDHLTENNEYYSILIKSGLVDENKALELSKQFLNITTSEDTPNDSVQANAAADVDKPEGEENDKEMTNMLLGFKPHNVGDEIEGDEETEKTPEVEPEKKEDELGEAEAGFEEYTGNIGDRYADDDGNEFVVHNKVKGGVTLKTQSGEIEVATSDLKFYKKLNEGETAKKIITEEQIKTAKRTLSNSKVPTGMTKKEAVQILMNNNLKKIL